MSVEILDKLKERFPEAIEETHQLCGDETARVARSAWLEAVKFLRDEMGMNMFIDLTAVDYLGRESGLPRFEVVLHLRNNETNQRIRLKARVPESSCSIASLCSLYKGADWFERECHEMYGIKFAGHPDLRPLLLYPEFQGYPLRKDYPIAKTQPRIPLLAPEHKPSRRAMDETEPDELSCEEIKKAN